MTSKHTPGPWYCFKRSPCENILITDKDYDNDTALVDIKIIAVIQPEINNYTQIANARLIAAAPDTAAERDCLKEENEILTEGVHQLASLMEERDSLKAINAKLLKALMEALPYVEDIAEQRLIDNLNALIVKAKTIKA